jgi:sporulation protein YlmC with PRC-barrel domain
VTERLYRGWSVRDQILGHDVFNDRGDNVGRVADLIVAPDEKVTYAIIGTGGFLGLGERYVAFPVDRLRLTDGKIVLPGATRASIEAEPEFSWSSRR